MPFYCVACLPHMIVIAQLMRHIISIQVILSQSFSLQCLRPNDNSNRQLSVNDFIMFDLLGLEIFAVIIFCKRFLLHLPVMQTIIRGLRVLPKQRIGAKEYPDSLLACQIDKNQQSPLLPLHHKSTLVAYLVHRVSVFQHFPCLCAV